MSKGKSKQKEAPAPEASGEEGGEGAPPPTAKKGLPLKLILIGVGALALLGGGGGAGAYMLVIKPKADAKAAAAAKDGAHGPADAHGAKDDHGKKDKKKKKDGGHGGGGDDKSGFVVAEGPDGVVFCTLPDITANMQTADGRPSYLQLKLTFEAPDEHVADLVKENMPRLQDMFQGFLRELRPEDLAGSQGNYQLRQEIQRRVNLVIAPAKVNAVLIEKMLQT